jgi:predicted MPP superfamily phosphohydrolase
MPADAPDATDAPDAAPPRAGRLRRAGAVASRAGAVAGRAVGRALTGRAARQVGWGLAIIAVAVVGVVLGVLIGGRTESDIGPFSAELQVTPSLVGDAEVHVPPLGALHLDSHDGPAHLTVRFDQLDPRRTEQLIREPDGVARASQDAVDDVTTGAIKLSLRTLAVAVLATLVLAALIFRDTRRVAWSGAFALVITFTSLSAAVGTFRVNALEEPRYEGLLVRAPAVIGDARRIANQYDAYAAQLQKLVNNVGEIYTTVSTLPVYQAEPGSTRLLHVSDLHLNPTAWSIIETVVDQFAIDLVVDTGDINDWGSEPEASYLAPISRLDVPYVYVRGNHDSALTAAAVARHRNAVVLDNQVARVAGLTVAGISDPRFTPDKEASPTGSGASKQTVERVIDAGSRLAETIGRAGRPVDVALVHDPASAGPLSGVCPVVLAGHTHRREVRLLNPPAEDAEPTRLVVSGSTGGAGLRGLEGAEPVPLSLSILYLNAGRRLQAYDDIRVGGTGQSQVTLERHVVDDDEEATPGAQAPLGTRPTPTAPAAPTGTPGAPTPPAGTPSPGG